MSHAGKARLQIIPLQSMRLLLTLLALTCFLPQNAHAYLTPEEVLEAEDLVEAPPNARNAEAARAAQEARYDARAEHEGAEAEPASGTIDDLHGSADEVLVESIDWEPVGNDLTPEERRDERVLERLERTRLENQGREPAPVILHGSADEPLHGGAPLAPTGTGTIVLLLAGSLAVGFTLRLALKTAIRL